MSAAVSPLPDPRPAHEPVDADPDGPGLLVSAIDGVLVLSPQGVLDAHCLDALHHLLRHDSSTPAVIDLSNCTLIDPSLLAQVDPRQWERTAALVCVACRRPTGRLLLRRAGVPNNLTVFHGVEDALQARTFAESGFGHGWQRD